MVYKLINMIILEYVLQCSQLIACADCRFLKTWPFFFFAMVASPLGILKKQYPAIAPEVVH